MGGREEGGKRHGIAIAERCFGVVLRLLLQPAHLVGNFGFRVSGVGFRVSGVGFRV